MPDFSTIGQTPQVRAIVQENMLERTFHDALYPNLMFRAEAMEEEWPANVGDTMVFTGVGLMKKRMRPLLPGTDPTPSQYPKEQWTAQLQQYADSIDTPMPSSIAAIASIFLRDAHQIGLGGGQTLNALNRNAMYNAAISGNTNAIGAQIGTTSLHVYRMNGFTKARSAAGSVVKYDTVSGSNPLAILVTAALTPVNVIGFTPDNPGDALGPGVLTLDAAVTVADRDPILAVDRSRVTRVGGGLHVDSIGSNNRLTLADIRSALTQMQNNNVMPQPDGRFHCHLDAVSIGQVFSDPEFNRLLTSLPDFFMYREFALGELLGCVFLRNIEAPRSTTVDGASTATTSAPFGFSLDDPFGGEIWSNGNNATGVEIHRPLFVGEGGLREYWQNLDQLITEAGVTGKAGEPKVTNNGIEVMTERVRLIIRAPLDRLQQSVSISYSFIGDFPVRTDGTTGDAQRYKRVSVIEHGA